MYSENWVTRIDNQRKDHHNPERSSQKNTTKQLQIHYMPTDDVENTNGTNYGENLLTD